MALAAYVIGAGLVGAGAPATAATIDTFLSELFVAPAATAPTREERHGRGRTRHAGRRPAARRERIAQGLAPERVATKASSSVGLASYYSGSHATASGAHVGRATCAHRWLPFGTVVRVTNLKTLQSANLVVNDRGPFVRGRIIDVSRASAPALGMIHSGTARVRVDVVAAN